MLLRPDRDEARAASAAPGSRRGVRLVANSGIQHVDLAIECGGLERTLAVFVEDRIEDELGARSALTLVPPDGHTDTIVFHPVNHAPVPPERVLWLNGFAALEPFLGRWLPLPFLRLQSARAGARPPLDEGPLDWARLYLAAPVEGLRTAARIEAVIAFDTRTGDTSRVDKGRYLAPTLDDVRFGSSFALIDDLDDLAGFLAEPWIEAWLADIVQAGSQAKVGLPGAEREEASGGAPAPRFTSEHVARYYTLLKVLATFTDLPDVRFVAEADGRRQARIGVDLVLDISNRSTAALLVERGGEQTYALLDDAVTLSLRDLSLPTRSHAGPIPTEIEFSRASFGGERFSRRGGRADA
jgi:hypothetical protein